MTAGRWATIIGLASALYFALQGGEYGTLDLLQLRREEAAEQANVQRLELLVDSLTKAAVAIELDPRTQERVARERFGMIKKGEFLYRLVPSSESVASEKREREQQQRER
ncbi:MAG TPA: septum formation initiator family protein [Gemmatimonadales bacterium]|nr:septum formation initiator family protein [Gemmatimonadales bacterium]